MWAYGRYLGMAFQVDRRDLLDDKRRRAGAVGKPVGNDLRSGVLLTLPVLYVIRSQGFDGEVSPVGCKKGSHDLGRY